MSHRTWRKALVAVAIVATSILAVSACSSGGGTGKSGGGSSVSAIKVGLVFPTSGAFAVLGKDQQNGVKMVLDWANKHGGVDGVPIKIFEGDTQSDPGTGATVAQRLIDRHGVNILIGSYSSGIAQAMLPVAQRNNVVLWEVGAVSPTINKAGNPDFIRTVGGSETYAKADMDFLKGFLAPKLGKSLSDVRVAIAHEDGAFGSSVAEAIVGLAKKENVNIVDKEAYNVKSSDLTPVILRLKAAKPDVLFITPLVADAMLFWQQAKTQNFNVKAIVGSAGFSSSSFVKKFGKQGVQGAFDVEAPAIEFMKTDNLKPSVKKLVDTWRDKFKKEYGHPCLVHCGDGLGGGYILVHDVLPRALKDSDSVDAKAIIAAADKTNIPDGGTPQGFGAKFAPVGGKHVGDNIDAKSYIMQWQDGQLKVVWPKKVAVAAPMFPMPTWSER